MESFIERYSCTKNEITVKNIIEKLGEMPKDAIVTKIQMLCFRTHALFLMAYLQTTNIERIKQHITEAEFKKEYCCE